MPHVILFICNRIYREGLRQILIDRREFDGVHACSETSCLRAAAAASRFAVILVDVFPGVQGGFDVGMIAAAHDAGNGRPVIALGLDGADDEVLASIEAGAAGFITKNDSIDDLLRAIHATAAGEFRCAPHIARLMQERLVTLSAERGRNCRLDKLSLRERHILKLVGEDLSNKEIARQLGREVSTIKNHVHSIIVKLSVRNRNEATAMARSSAVESRP